MRKAQDYDVAVRSEPVRGRPLELVERTAWSSAKHPIMSYGRLSRF
jgi:hypothetical protein